MNEKEKKTGSCDGNYETRDWEMMIPTRENMKIGEVKKW